MLQWTLVYKDNKTGMRRPQCSRFEKTVYFFLRILLFSKKERFPPPPQAKGRWQRKPKSSVWYTVDKFHGNTTVTTPRIDWRLLLALFSVRVICVGGPLPLWPASGHRASPTRRFERTDKSRKKKCVKMYRGWWRYVCRSRRPCTKTENHNETTTGTAAFDRNARATSFSPRVYHLSPFSRYKQAFRPRVTCCRRRRRRVPSVISAGPRDFGPSRGRRESRFFRPPHKHRPFISTTARAQKPYEPVVARARYARLPQ